MEKLKSHSSRNVCVRRNNNAATNFCLLPPSPHFPLQLSSATCYKNLFIKSIYICNCCVSVEKSSKN